MEGGDQLEDHWNSPGDLGWWQKRQKKKEWIPEVFREQNIKDLVVG